MTPSSPSPPAAPVEDTESVAGEEDPGSALEQFSDLMHEAPRPGQVPAAEGAERERPAPPAPPGH